MERISAAYAMDWSIQLEKSLRSKKPGGSMEAILQIGAKLSQWSKENEPSMAVHKIFGLVPGEDKLFLNSILLRLANAFKFGDKDTRLAVVKVMLLEFKNRDKKKKSKGYRGIFSKARVNNHLELLKRVKIVFDTGDVESRAMALVLFGCWADFAKDSAHIRYLILSSLVSSEILEVRASLFAAGCFCELADDFASVVLEMLLSVVTATETSLTVRLAGARVFAKMACSYSIANRAYKEGLNLIMHMSDDQFLVAMLISLSKLASKSSLLLSDQVDLLLSFLSQERTVQLQATAIRCLHFLFIGGGSHSFPTSVVNVLFRMVDDTNLPLAIQCEALQILHKVLLYKVPNLDDNTSELACLSTIVENSARSPLMSKNLVAIRILVDITKKYIGQTKTGSVGNSSSFLLMQSILIILDRITFLVKPFSDLCQTDARVFKEVQCLLSLLLSLVGEHPDFIVLVLEKIKLSIEFLVGTHDSTMATMQAGLLVNEIVAPRGGNCTGTSLKLVYIVCTFLARCIECIDDVGGITGQILDKVKLLVDFVISSGVFDCYILITWSILLHTSIVRGFVLKKIDETVDHDVDMGHSLYDHAIEYEIFSLDCSKKMFTERNFWNAYKAGTFAACQGAWVTAAFIFEQLISRVQSEPFSCWLKSLAQFAQSERKVHLFVLPKLQSRLLDWSQKEEYHLVPLGDNFSEMAQGVCGNRNEPNYTQVLVRAYYGHCYSGRTLKSIVISSECIFFQRWFLALRAKVVGAVVDVLNVLGTISLNQNTISNQGDTKKGVAVKFLDSLQQITQMSFQMRWIAQEFDLIATSFIGMDRRSSEIISALALSTSLLAFASGFALHISNLPVPEILTSCGLKISKNSLQEMLIQDLVGRLWVVDRQICSNLCMLLEISREPKQCFHLQSRNRVLKTGTEVRGILNICKFAVSGIVGLQTEAKTVHNEGILFQVAKEGLQLLLNIIPRWMQIPFRVPKYFFKVRPCLGSELFVFSPDAGNPNELLVSLGFYLSLNLCLQLKNIPADLSVRVTKLYCILCSSASLHESGTIEETKGQPQVDHGAWDTDMVEMNEKLWLHVTEDAKKTNNCKCGRDVHVHNNARTSHTFVHLELTAKGQGFSSCLLDVSKFPVGSYRIKWQSCFIDSQGCYWSLLPLNAGPMFTVQEPLVGGQF